MCRFVLFRGLTSNPRLKQIVDVVRKLNVAFQADSDILGTVLSTCDFDRVAQLPFVKNDSLL